MRALTIFVTAGLMGCSTADAPMSWKVTEANARGYVIEVTTLPGAEVMVGTTSIEADGTGLARFDFPIATISYMKSVTTMQVVVHGRKWLTKFVGGAQLELPFSPEDAAQIPSGSNWLRVLGGGNDVVSGERATVWSFGEEGGALLKADGSLELHLLGPPNATVTLEGHTAMADALGRVTLPFTTEEVLRLIPVGALTARIMGKPAPVSAAVSVEGKPPVVVRLAAYWSAVSAASFRQAFSAASSKPRAGQRGSPSLVLYLASDGNLVGEGREASLSEVDVLGLATGAPARKMEDCEGYQATKAGVPVGAVSAIARNGVDEEIVAIDAHTGKELGRKNFTADEAQCPSMKWSGDRSTFEARPKPAEVTAWLATL